MSLKLYKYISISVYNTLVQIIWHSNKNCHIDEVLFNTGITNADTEIFPILL